MSETLAATAPVDLNEATAIATCLFAREGLFLDERQWDAWLDLYLDDCVFWVPTWKDEDETVGDTAREVSLIYHDSRRGLEERVARLRSRKSVTAMPLPRTVHLVSNILVSACTAKEISGSASWRVEEYDPRRGVRRSNCGRYAFTLRKTSEDWKIARKKVVLLDDVLPPVIDFYGL